MSREHFFGAQFGVIVFALYHLKCSNNGLLSVRTMLAPYFYPFSIWRGTSLPLALKSLLTMIKRVQSKNVVEADRM